VEKTPYFPFSPYKKEKQNRILFKSWGDSPKRKTCISHNVPAYAMFASGIIARSAYHWQIWVEACGGTEQAVTAYAVLADVFLFFSDGSRLF